MNYGSGHGVLLLQPYSTLVQFCGNGHNTSAYKQYNPLASLTDVYGFCLYYITITSLYIFGRIGIHFCSMGSLLYGSEHQQDWNLMRQMKEQKLT